jgi:hypothetical protein
MLYVLEHDTIPVDPSLHAFMHACTYEKVVFDGARAGATGWWQIYPLNVVESGTAVRFKGCVGLLLICGQVAHWPGVIYLCWY